MAQKINVPINCLIKFKQFLHSSPLDGRIIATAAQHCRQLATVGGNNWQQPKQKLNLPSLVSGNSGIVQFVSSPFSTTIDGPNDNEKGENGNDADEEHQQQEENLDDHLAIRVENYEQIYELSCKKIRKGFTLLANETIQNEEFKRASNIVADKFLNEVVESMYSDNIYASLQIDVNSQKTMNFLKILSLMTRAAIERVDLMLFIGPYKFEEFLLIGIGNEDWVSPPINFAEHAQSLVIILEKAWAFLNTWKADDKNLDHTVIYSDFIAEREGSEHFGLKFELWTFGGLLFAEIFLIKENNDKIEPSFFFEPEYIPKMRETIAGWLHENQ